MPKRIKCGFCKGKGYDDFLISAHSDETEFCKCPKCNGNGVINQMTENEEEDYWRDYW